MAYSHPNLHRIGPSNSSTPTLWSYSTTDATAVVNSESYFDDAAADLTVGDIIIANTSTGGTLAAGIYLVSANDGTTVDVNDALVVTATDTD